MFLTIVLLLVYGTQAELEFPSDWHKKVFDKSPLLQSNCGHLEKYGEQLWENLPYDTQKEMMHCFIKGMWSEKLEDDPLYKESGNTPCDLLMTGKEWTEMDEVEKSFSLDCIHKWIIGRYYLRLEEGLEWMPGSYLYDLEMREKMMNDAERCVLIKSQYQFDQKLSFDRVLPVYHTNAWSEASLNNSHYIREDITTEEAWKQFQKEVTLEDYVAWNNVKGCKALHAYTQFHTLKLENIDPTSILGKMQDGVYVYYTKDIEWKHPE